MLLDDLLKCDSRELIIHGILKDNLEKLCNDYNFKINKVGIDWIDISTHGKREVRICTLEVNGETKHF